jgi:hypothetical protein
MLLCIHRLRDGKPLATRQRGDGFTRVVGGRVDIGAFEVRGRFLNHIFDEPDRGRDH